MSLTQITDYEARLVALLPAQFRGTNWLKLFAALAGTGAPLQEQEDTLIDLYNQRRSLTLATGAQLAQWGKLVGLSNQGWTDDSYRARILVWLQVLRSKGTPDELIRITSDMCGENLDEIDYWETPPASYSIQYPGGLYTSDPVLAVDIAVYLAKADPAGVGVGQIISLPATPFLFGSVAANGFSQAGGTTRGLFATDVSTEAGV